MSTEQITIEWADVKRRFIDSVRHGKRWGQPMQSRLMEHHQNPYRVDEWACGPNGSGASVLEWLDNGFRSPELETAAHAAQTDVVKRTAWSEEDGDIDVGRLYGGYDDFYLGTAESPVRPGLRIVADCFFAASVNPRVVREYGAWLAGLIATLETRGYDLEVDLVARVTELHVKRNGRTDMHIRVKRAGELSDFTEWSALFSPAGVRRLVFTGFGVASDAIGSTMTSFCAMSLDRSRFDVIYDADANTLTVTADQRHTSRSLPRERMDAALAESGLV